jgi:hypothetical protein
MPAKAGIVLFTDENDYHSAAPILSYKIGARQGKSDERSVRADERSVVVPGQHAKIFDLGQHLRRILCNNRVPNRRGKHGEKAVFSDCRH